MSRERSVSGSARPRRPFVAALTLVQLGLAAVGIPPALAAAGASDDLDAQIQSALDGVPAEKGGGAVVEWILQAHEGTTSYHAVSPASLFQAGQPTQDLVLDSATGSVWIDDNQGSCGYAPIHLPQAATVTGFLMWVRDSNSVEDSTAILRRFTVDGSTGVLELAAVTSSGSTANSRVFSDFSISSGVVDNSTYWYFVHVCLPRFSDPDGPT